MGSDRDAPATTDSEPLLRSHRCAVCGHVSLVSGLITVGVERWAASCERCGELIDVGSNDEEMSGRRTNAPMRQLGDVTEMPERLSGPTSALTSGGAPGHGTLVAPSVRPLRVWWSGLTPIVLAHELWYSWVVSRRLLALCRRVRAEQPTMSGRALYEVVVVRWFGSDCRSARVTLRRAEQSFVSWTDDRELTFRDVSLYIVLDTYSRANPWRRGASNFLVRVVTRVIPDSL